MVVEGGRIKAETLLDFYTLPNIVEQRCGSVGQTQLLLLTREQNPIKILRLFPGCVEGHYLAAAASFALD